VAIGLAGPFVLLDQPPAESEESPAIAPSRFLVRGVAEDRQPLSDGSVVDFAEHGCAAFTSQREKNRTARPYRRKWRRCALRHGDDAETSAPNLAAEHPQRVDIRQVSVVLQRNTQARPSFSLVSLVIRLGCTRDGSPGILG
jgi:hypothetical protein